ncbi:MAG: toprim domain-containing protein [Candidatus Brocadiales bacterium]|nr:toprim domain-containing protein [Candidatus Brocadiales bacterium]
MRYSSYDIKKKTDTLRNIKLESILAFIGAEKNKYDKNRWNTDKGVISVSGLKFMNWTLNTGGGGAIDLVIHLKNFCFKDSVIWLAHNFHTTTNDDDFSLLLPAKPLLQLPDRDDSKLSKVMQYLLYDRRIPYDIIGHLIDSGQVYADGKNNAVFLLLGKEKRIVGAELRGITKVQWRGMAKGTKKNLGCFYVKTQVSKKIVLCESAIDAISYYAIYQDAIAVSTSGATSKPIWLQAIINKGYDIFCGFDSDKTGDCIAKQLIELYPTVKRLRPHKHDWNDVLCSETTL